MPPNPFTQDQVRKLCVQVGFSTDLARIASAIAMVEAPYSRDGKSYSDCALIGDQALANDTWGFSYGFFQIRSKRSELGTGSWRDANLLPDPLFNCKAALKVYQSQGWGAWTTYRTGQYKAYLPDLFPPPAGVYVVRYGDTLSGIASRLKIGAWTDLARVNGLHDPYTIYIGQNLLLPWVEVTVKPGDTLGRIVDNYGMGVTITRVAEFNKITNPDRISPGQVIKIPRSTL